MTPKMQLTPGDYITQSFRAEINAWMIDFFGYEEDEPVTQKPQVTHDVELRIAPTKKVRTAKRKHGATQVQPDTETFAGLLEGLEDSFYTMMVPPISGSWLTKKEVNSIKKMGVYVPDTLELDIADSPTIPKAHGFPAIASSYFVPRKMDEDDKLFQRFVYAIKGAKLPENVEMTKGVPYQFGACYEMKHEENGKDMKPKMFWAWCWMVIKADGSIVIPHEMRQMSVQIRHKNAQSGYKGQRGSRQSTAHIKHWCVPTMAIAETGREQSAHENYLKCAFRQLLKFWAGRSDKWSVGVRKDGHRVTFSIAQEHTSAYFADRETVVNVEGKPKKIVHFVREHVRVTGAVVKAHIRGLREFDWKGYHCVVTAPLFKGVMATTLDIEPILLETDDTSGEFISTQELAVRLADIEDTP